MIKKQYIKGYNNKVYILNLTINKEEEKIVNITTFRMDQTGESKKISIDTNRNWYEYVLKLKNNGFVYL
jgi:hypothetical protein